MIDRARTHQRSPCPTCGTSEGTHWEAGTHSIPGTREMCGCSIHIAPGGGFNIHCLVQHEPQASDCCSRESSKVENHSIRVAEEKSEECFSRVRKPTNAATTCSSGSEGQRKKTKKLIKPMEVKTQTRHVRNGHPSLKCSEFSASPLRSALTSVQPIH